MENIHEILKEYELEVPADKKAAFDKAWKENYRTKSEYDNAVSQRDKSQKDMLQLQMSGRLLHLRPDPCRCRKIRKR